MVTKQGGWARIRASVSPDADEGDKVKDKEEKRHEEDVKMRRCEDAKMRRFSFLFLRDRKPGQQGLFMLFYAFLGCWIDRRRHADHFSPCL